MTTEWISVEFDGGRLYARVHDGEDPVIADLQAEIAEGEAAETALERMLAPHLENARGVPVICAGLGDPAAAVPVPAAPPLQTESRVAAGGRMDLRLLPGLRQSEPPDLTSGAEIRVAGLLAEQPGFDGVLCLPGPRTLWIHVSAGEIVSFRATLTGELAGLLETRSSLSPALAGTEWNAALFTATLRDVMSRPQGVAQGLAGLAAAHALGSTKPGEARARLYGMLVGIDMSAARPYWLGQRVAVLGDDRLADAYHAALDGEGAFPERLDGQAMAEAGFRAARAAMGTH
ncbi:2-keto-3-deoxy-galactonokinase [Aquicoccus sp. SCR17]|nr:2-keto-3-deoxy-galactonokinase [Carideicomes alvinocaridis]